MGSWQHTDHDLHGDQQLQAALARRGISIAPSEPQLPVESLDDSGLV